MFDNIARRLFGHNQKTASSLMTRLKKYFRHWILDGVYDPVIFESSLKDTFGSGRRLFGTSEGQISGSKVAVITASISDATPFVLSNYNGVLPTDQSHGMYFTHEAPLSAELLQPMNC
jgi:hypothetical protein